MDVFVEGLYHASWVCRLFFVRNINSCIGTYGNIVKQHFDVMLRKMLNKYIIILIPCETAGKKSGKSHR